MSRSRKRKGGRQTSGKKEFGWKRVSHRRGNGTHLCTLVPEEIAFCGLPPPLPEELGAPVIKKGEGEGRTHDRATLLKKWIKFKPPLSLCLFRSIFDPPLLLSLLSFVPPRHFCQPTFSLLLLLFFFFSQFSNKARKNLSNGPSSKRGEKRGEAGRVHTPAKWKRTRLKPLCQVITGDLCPPTESSAYLAATWPSSLSERNRFLRTVDAYHRMLREKKEAWMQLRKCSVTMNVRMKGMIDRFDWKIFDVSSEVAVNVSRLVNGRMNYGQMNP